MPVVAVAPVVDVADPPDAHPAERDGDDQPPPAVPRRPWGRSRRGRSPWAPPSVARSRASSTRAPARWATTASRDVPGHRRRGDGQAHPPGPAGAGRRHAEGHGGGHLDQTHLDRQLARDPAQGEADHGERLRLTGRKALTTQDREGNADCQKHPGHPQSNTVWHEKSGSHRRGPADRRSRGWCPGQREDGHGTTERTRRQLPLPRDPEPAHACGADVGASTRRRFPAATRSGG